MKKDKFVLTLCPHKPYNENSINLGARVSIFDNKFQGIGVIFCYPHCIKPIFYSVFFTFQNYMQRVSYRFIRNMHVKALPMRWGYGDNYAYILSDDSTNKSWIIDPAYPKDLLGYLSKDTKSDMTAIVNTHHHYDHAGGNGYFLSHEYKNLPVIAGKDSEHVSYTPSDGEIIQLGDDIEITAIHTPCHTKDSICYYAFDKKTKQRCVFTGDTLFTSGCGRFFEGTGADMKKSLEKLTALPDDTVVYPGHEYTASNVKFSKSIFGNSNAALNKLEDFCNSHEFTTGRFTIKDEKEFNPFIRLTDPIVNEVTQSQNPVEVMNILREMKNNF